jgi:hypothetical protein
MKAPERYVIRTMSVCLVLTVSTPRLHMKFVIALVIRLWKKFADFVHISMSDIIPEICTVVVLTGNSSLTKKISYNV